MHKLDGLVYRMLKYGTDYVRRSTEEYEQKIRAQLERALQRKPAALGYELVPKPSAPPEPTAGPLLP